MFIVGNGSWGSTLDANFHGLRAFISRVPARYISCIRIIDFRLHLRSWHIASHPYSPNRPKLTGIVRTSNNLQDAKTIARLSVKHFTGLQLLEVEIITKPGSLDTRMNGLAQLSKNASGNGITNLVKILLGHRHVQLDLIFEEWYVDLQECVKMAWIGTSGPQATVTIIKDKRRGERVSFSRIRAQATMRGRTQEQSICYSLHWQLGGR